MTGITTMHCSIISNFNGIKQRFMVASEHEARRSRIGGSLRAHNNERCRSLDTSAPIAPRTTLI